MPKARVYVTLDDTNTAAVDIIMQALGVSASRAVNILCSEGIEHSSLLVRGTELVAAAPQPTSRRRKTA